MRTHEPAIAAAARLALTQWWSRLGETGITTMQSQPWLLALIDQHAAQVRDAVADRRGAVTAANLAAYADGVADTAGRHGWSWTEVADGDWSRASWPSLRLLAVAVLAGPALAASAT